MKGYKNRGIKAAILCLILLLTSFKIQVKAATVDDLRELTGTTLENNENTEESSGEIEDNTIENNTTISTNTGATFGKANSGEQYNASLVRMEARLEQGIYDNVSAKVLTYTVDSIIQLKDEIEQSKKEVYYENVANNGGGAVVSGGLSGNIGDTTTEEETEKVAVSSDERQFELDKEINAADFKIGGIGDLCTTVTGEYKRLETPWGYMVNSKGEIIGEKLLGIDFYIIPGNEVKSQWNGIIYRVEEDKLTGESTIIINHGRGLFTYYSHVKDTENLKIGDFIAQGNKIGEGIDTSKYEPNKNNHIFYQISIDGNFINPLIAYGNSGEGLYNDWYTTHSDINAVEDSEEYFIIKEYDMEDTEQYKVEGVEDIEESVLPDYKDESWKDKKWDLK